MGKLSFLVILLSLLLCRSVRADGEWSLLTADFRRQNVTLISLDEAALHAVVRGDSAQNTVPLARFLMLVRGSNGAAVVAKGLVLYMVSGDRVAGELVGMKDDILTWKSAALGEMALSVRDLQAMAPADASAEIFAQHKEDLVLLSNKDSAAGIVTGIDAQNLLIQPGSGDAISLPRSSVAGIFFAAAGKPSAADARVFRIRFSDGSVFTVPGLKIADGKLLLRLAANGKGEAVERSVDLESITAIEQLNGPVGWLSARQPAVNEQAAYSADQHFAARMDRNVRGGPIAFAGRTYERGIGVHANSKLVYDLDGAFKAFRTQYAIDGGGDVRYADVTVRVLVDDQVIHEQASFKAGVLSPVIEADLEGHKTLTLEVLAAPGNFGTQDRLNWIEPALLREKPAVAPVPAAALPAAVSATAPATKP